MDSRHIGRAAATAAAALALTLGGCAISTQQEIEMGSQYAQQINQQLPIVSDPEVNRYINVLGDSIAGLTSRGELQWHFYIVDSREVNAFAVPGGFIYVNRGLIERADRMDELAGAIGHEIGHVVRRHSIKQMEKAQNANVGVTLACVLTRVCESPAAQAAINVGANAVFAKFSREDETEADAEGVKNVVRAGIDPRGMVDLFQVLLEERQSRPAGVEAWFLTHPLEEDRIREVSALVQQIDPAIIQGLTKDSRAYQAFRQRVMSLPYSGK
jgi:predicted Zn-dependent protease